MKAIKTLLAVSALTIGASAMAAPVSVTLDTQIPPFGTQALSGDLSWSGDLNIDAAGTLLGLTFTTDGAYTSTSSMGPIVTFAAGSTWTANVGAGLAITSLTPTGSGGFNVVYSWGTNGTDSNAAGSFSSLTSPNPTCTGSNCSFATAGSPAWDMATLTIVADAAFNPLSISLSTTEVGSFGNAVSNYTLVQAPAEVPLPAAAWLFGSGLIGLAGVVRRRRAAA